MFNGNNAILVYLKKRVNLRFKHKPVNEVFQNSIHLIWYPHHYILSEK